MSYVNHKAYGTDHEASLNFVNWYSSQFQAFKFKYISCNPFVCVTGNIFEE